MTFFSRIRLSYKIVGSLILIFASLFIVLGAVINYVMENTISASEKQKANLLLQTVEKPLQMTLYLKFYDQLVQKVSPVVSVTDVMALDIVDRNGYPLYNYVSRTRTQHDAVNVSREIYEPITGEVMGTISLSYSDRAYDETRQSVRKIVLYVSFVMGVLFFMAIWWVSHLLSPLRKIAQKARTYKPGDRMSFEEDGSIEIEQIVSAFKSMQETAHTYLRQIEDMNSSLEVAVQEKTYELESQYYIDALTKLPNRYRLQEKLLKERISALAIVNIDDFKEANDFFGIDIGDEMLVQLGLWLNELSGNCYRLGSDEFALIFSEKLNQSEVEHRLAVLIKLLDEKTFLVNEESLNIRITIGVAMGSEKVLTRADIALHHAKENKKQIAFYNEDEGIEEQYRSNLLMASNIRKALYEHRIVCYYQPIADFRTGEIRKYETLVRMIDEEGNIIPPIAFLPIAKQTKLYPQITLEVVYQACTLFASRDEEFSINLSDSDIRNPHTVNEILRTITETGTASRVVFEILESEGIESYDEVVDFITKVKEHGAKIAIDDFGTGYSNFENILKLNVDYIKIDGSLIRELTGNERHRIILETIIDFAQKIDADTIAEFVGDEEIYSTLKIMGVDYSQGYYTGKPIPLT